MAASPEPVAMAVDGEPAVPKSAEGAQQGKVTGIIIPPPDIRVIVDKTARFVAKNGRAFEQRILVSDDGKSAKFNFMRPHDPYYGYYETKISEFENGDAPPPAKPDVVPEDGEGATAAGAGEQPKAAAATPGVVVRRPVMAPIAKAALAMDKEVPPPAFQFSSGHPPGLTALDVDMIKLTAQYAAVGGRAFLNELARSNEGRLGQFQFIRTNHALFSYFTALVDAYAKVLTPTQDQKDLVEQGCDRRKLLERVVHRWEHQRSEEAKKKARAAQQDAERVAYRSIDWHDFVVVECIEFPEDEMIDGGLGDEGNALLEDLPEEEEQEEEEDVSAANVPEEPAQDEDVDMDMDMEEEDEGDATPPAQAHPRPPLPPPEDDDEAIRVVSNYTPAVAAAGGSAGQLPETVIDPISGQAVPIGELSEHMRVQLLDPKWREEQARALAKQKETAYAEGESIANSLRALARKRGDIFGSAEEEEAQLIRESERRHQRMEETSRMIWDGHSSSVAAMQQKSLERQLAPPVPTQSAAPPRPAIGPSSIAPPPSRAAPPAQAFPRVLPPPPPRPTPSAAMAVPPPPPRPQPTEPQGGLGGIVPPGPPPRPGGVGGPGPMGVPGLGRASPPLPLPGNGAMGGLPMAVPPPPPRPEAQAPPPPARQGGDMLVPEEEFAARNPGPVRVRVLCPVDPSDDNLQGQTLEVQLPVDASVQVLKERLEGMLGGMPPKKQQLRDASKGFLKDSQSFAFYNLSGTVTLELVPRSRGGR